VEGKAAERKERRTARRAKAGERRTARGAKVGERRENRAERRAARGENRTERREERGERREERVEERGERREARGERRTARSEKRGERRTARGTKRGERREERGERREGRREARGERRTGRVERRGERVAGRMERREERGERREGRREVRGERRTGRVERRGERVAGRLERREERRGRRTERREAIRAALKHGQLTVTGEGQIKVRPDIALLDLDVVTTAKTAQDATQQNADRMTAVMDALKAQGIDESDLQTIGFDVMPVMDWDEKSPTKGQIISYRVSSQLRARVDVEKAGQIIDVAVRAGANMASGIRFGLRDETAVRSRALKLAVQAAHRDATSIAESIKARLHGTSSIEASMAGAPTMFREVAMAAAKSATPIEPGTITVSAHVRVVFRYA
jgi:hypothetical protein